MKTTMVWIVILIFSSICSAQITEDNIKQLLIVQGISNPESRAKDLYNEYTENKQVDLSVLNTALAESALSGVSMGLNQSRNSYTTKDIAWLPKFMQSWYMNSCGTDNIFGKFFTWQKIFREADYMSDRLAYEDLNRFFEGKWYLAAISDIFIKNITGAMIRNKMNTGSFL